MLVKQPEAAFQTNIGTTQLLPHRRQRLRRLLKMMRNVAGGFLLLHLLLLSVLSSTAIFGVLRAFNTSTTHKIPFFFDMSTKLPTAKVTLPYTTITDSSVFEASIHLKLPESSTNLANSVFITSLELYNEANGKYCLSRGVSHFVMRYKSPLHRALRAVVFSVPLLLGVYSEYQDMTLHTISYRVGGAVGMIPRHAVVSLSSSDVQVSAAHLIVHVGRPTLASYILHQHFLSFVMLTLSFWFGLVFAAGITYLVVYKVCVLTLELLAWMMGSRFRSIKKEAG